MTPEELEAQLRTEAEVVIKRTVEKYRESEHKTISEIEAAAVGVGQHMKAAALKGMVEARPSEAVPEGCPTCGGRLQAKGKRAKWIQTQAGEVRGKKPPRFRGGI